MEKNKQEEVLELKTLEDVDNKGTEQEPNKEEPKSELETRIAELEKERDTYKEKYTKAVEINNQLYQRLTSPKPTPSNETSALDKILNRF